MGDVPPVVFGTLAVNSDQQTRPPFDVSCGGSVFVGQGTRLSEMFAPVSTDLSDRFPLSFASSSATLGPSRQKVQQDGMVQYCYYVSAQMPGPCLR